MAEKPTPDPYSSAWAWALRRGPVHLDRFIVSAAVLGFAGVAAAYGLPDSMPLKALAVVVIAIVAAIAAAYGWALLRAPYEQRNSLRVSVTTLTQQIDREKERLHRLRTAKKLEGESFYVWELLPADAVKPVVIHRVFIDCVFRGPAVIGFLGEIRASDISLGEAPLDSVLLEMVAEGDKQGIIGLLNCEMRGCRLERVAIFGNKELLDKIRSVTTVV